MFLIVSLLLPPRLAKDCNTHFILLSSKIQPFSNSIKDLDISSH